MLEKTIFSYHLLSVYLLLTSFVGLIVYFVAPKIKILNDKNRHKFKKSKAVVIGGLIILINLLVSIKFFEFPKIMNDIIIFSILIFLLGFLDDLKPISATSRIFFQLIIIFAVISENKIGISNLGSYEYIGIIELGSISTIFTTMCVMLIMNSFNYNDGIDGWSNLNFINSNFILIIIILFFDIKNFINVPIIFILSCLIAFVLNFGFFNSTKIFLGNGGSLILGYLLSMELILFSNVSSIIHPIIIASILSYNVYEFISTNIYRIIKKKNLFKGGIDHFHYAVFFFSKKNIFVTNLILLFVQTIIATINICVYLYFGQLLALFIFIILFLLYFMLRTYLIEFRKK